MLVEAGIARVVSECRRARSRADPPRCDRHWYLSGQGLRHPARPARGKARGAPSARCHIRSAADWRDPSPDWPIPSGHRAQRGWCMRLVVFNEGRPGVLTDRGVVDVSSVVVPFGGQDGMRAIIQRFDEVQPALARLAADGPTLPLDSVALKAPLPRAKVLAMGGNYRENGSREPSPMWGFLKSTDSIVGDGATVVFAGRRRQHLPPRGRAGGGVRSGRRPYPRGAGDGLRLRLHLRRRRFGAHAARGRWRRRDRPDSDARVRSQVLQRLHTPRSLSSRPGTRLATRSSWTSNCG